MKNILVINAGSSSLKYQLIDIDSRKVIAKGLCERIGIAGSMLTYSPTDGEKVQIQRDMPTHEVAIKMVLEILTDSKVGVIHDMAEMRLWAIGCYMAAASSPIPSSSTMWSCRPLKTASLWALCTTLPT